MSTRLGAAAVFVIALSPVLMTAPASSEGFPTLMLNPTGGVMVQTGSASLDGTLDTPCDSIPSAGDVTLTIGGEVVTPESVTFTDESNFVIVIPAGHAPETADSEEHVVVSLDCQINASPQTINGSSVYGEIAVSKTVVGDAPVGADFTVLAQCEPADGPDVAGSLRPTVVPQNYNVDFQIAGGSSVSIFTFMAFACTLSETVTNGALTVTIEPGTVTTEDPILYTAVITNTFGTTPKFTG